MTMGSDSRNGASVVWLAVHTTEGIMRAADLLAWTSWSGSSHASSDESGALLTPADGFVPYDRAAWTMLSANPIAEQIEQCGWARWTRAEWLARPLLLDATARWLGERSKARGIPLVHLSDDDIRAHRPGVLGHGDYTRATGDGTHTDPGPNYPWDVVLDLARKYAAGLNPGGFLMALSDAEQHELLEAARYLKKGGEQDLYVHEIPARAAGAVAVKASAQVDPKALAAALAPLVVAALGQAKGLTAADVEAAMRKVFASASTPPTA